MKLSEFSFISNDVTTPTVIVDELRFRVLGPEIKIYEVAIQYTGMLWNTMKCLKNHKHTDLKIEITDMLFTTHVDVKATEWLDWANKVVDKIEQENRTV